jgi:hypothetical protein
VWIGKQDRDPVEPAKSHRRLFEPLLPRRVKQDRRLGREGAGTKARTFSPAVVVVR